MKIQVRLLLSFIALLLFVSSALSLSACKKDEDDDNGGTVNTGDVDLYADDLPVDLKFDNEEIRFLIAEVSGGLGGTFSERSIGIEGYTIGDAGTNTVDEEVYYRNLAVEDRLGVVIVPHVIQNAIILDTVNTQLRSGSGEFDIISGYQAHDIAMATEGMILNFNNLSSYGADYVDVEKEYWSKNYSKALSYNNAMYWVTGDLALRYLGGMYCTFVNLDIYNNMLLETYGNIYSLVDNNGWNLEIMAQMIQQSWIDQGTEEDIPDAGDTLGFVIENIDPLDGMSIGAGVTFSHVDESTGKIAVNLANDTVNPSAMKFAQAMYDILYNNNQGTLIAASKHSTNSMGLFAQGNVLFTHDKIFTAEVFLADMEKYGIIPSPMLNAQQGSYRAGIHDGCSLFGIYAMSPKIPAAAATLEAMASMTGKVTHSYYDEALKYRYSKDPESSRMIDLIRDSVYIDFAFAWGRSLNNIHNYFRTAISAKTAPGSNMFRKNLSIWNSKMDILLTALETQSGLAAE